MDAPVPDVATQLALGEGDLVHGAAAQGSRVVAHPEVVLAPLRSLGLHLAAADRTRSSYVLFVVLTKTHIYIYIYTHCFTIQY